jgi:hypothetical protein
LSCVACIARLYVPDVLRTFAEILALPDHILPIGVLSDLTPADLSIVEKSAIAAYGAMQLGSGYTLEEVKPLLIFGAGSGDDGNLKQCNHCPNDDAFLTGTVGFEKIIVADIKVLRSSQCNHCPNDDDDFVLENIANHQVFVESFCEFLATSGSVNLANANGCSFSFLQSPGHKVAPLTVVTRTEKNHGEAALGFLSINGLIHDLTDNEKTLVATDALETYNKAFGSSTGNSLASLHVRDGVVAPQTADGVTQCLTCHKITQCNHCPNDDYELSTPEGTVGNVLFLDIRLDQAAALGNNVALANTVDMKAVTIAFSRALCSKLRASGLPNLAFAGDCAMDFFYEHDMFTPQVV